jgi:hypothetical protein
MKRLKLTFNIPEDVVEMLETRITKRKRNTFVVDAIRARFRSLDEQQFLKELAEVNKARAQELAEIDDGLEPEDAILQSDEEMNNYEIAELDDII